MLQQLIDALVASKNEAADVVLVDALRLGTEAEQTVAMTALLRRKTVRGLAGVVGLYDRLPPAHQQMVIEQIKLFHAALRESGRSDDQNQRLAAMRLIALGRQGKLTYVLSESLHSTNDVLSRGAVEAIVALSRWVATETRRLQKTRPSGGPRVSITIGPAAASPADDTEELSSVYRNLIEQRADIESAVARAMDVHRGPHGPDLLRAALLLADSAQSKTLAILHTAKHGGQSPLVRRLQQPPEAEHVAAFLLGASHGGLRSHFGSAFGRIEEAPVLDALLRKTHWLKDHQLQLCMHQVNRGVWWGETELLRDLSRRDGGDAGKVGEWLAASGVHDVVQDARMIRLREHATGSFEARLSLLRLALRRPRGASVNLVKAFLADEDERLVRLAAREIIRRKPADFENTLLQLMTNASASVRRVISRSIGQVGFEHYWQRFDRMDRVTRRAAGRAMLKLLPDGVQRLARKMTSGQSAQQIKAVQMAQELQITDTLATTLQQLCADPNPKVRSKAVAALGELTVVPPDTLIDRALSDSDARVRANAIEVLESKQKTEYLPMLAQRAKAAQNRERANAIKAMHRMRVGTAAAQLGAMMQDSRPEHRISALWTLKQIGWWKLLAEVGRIAREDTNLRVRRYAFALLKDVSLLAHEQERAKAG